MSLGDARKMDRSFSACPSSPSPSLAGLSAATATFGNPLEQDTGTGVQSLGCRAWKVGCSLWGLGQRAQDTGHEPVWVEFCGHSNALCAV